MSKQILFLCVLSDWNLSCFIDTLDSVFDPTNCHKLLDSSFCNCQAEASKACYRTCFWWLKKAPVMYICDTTSCFALVRIPTVIKIATMAAAATSTATTTATATATAAAAAAAAAATTTTTTTTTETETATEPATGTATANRRGLGTFVVSLVCDALPKTWLPKTIYIQQYIYIFNQQYFAYRTTMSQSRGPVLMWASAHAGISKQLQLGLLSVWNQLVAHQPCPFSAWRWQILCTIG